MGITGEFFEWIKLCPNRLKYGTLGPDILRVSLRDLANAMNYDLLKCQTKIPSILARKHMGIGGMGMDIFGIGWTTLVGDFLL